ncbi:glutaredoxin-like protein [Acholeplasma morum]|jgi:glutaredoxin-like protein|uniref:protein disulfide oxidoreductase n=1 Tax=Paracholeplasma morum TaxID=264637 RepID=UPI001958C2BA|nr:thioredoxin family protein [Paracholeplasma morum]MBM7453744.1 glutaredoxin-like protein [Paracholeplasma morum]
MNKLFNAEVSAQIKSILDGMINPITIKLFVDGDCDTCQETKQLLTETAELSDKITLITQEVSDASDDLVTYNIEMTPSFVFLDADLNYRGVKFNGIPAGHEINSFLSAIMEMSGVTYELSNDVLKRIEKINKPVDIKVFVTLSCPHCPGAVQTAHRIAMLNPNVKGQMIEAQTFYDLSNKFNVSGVPKIIINDSLELLGNQPIEEFLKKIESL